MQGVIELILMSLGVMGSGLYIALSPCLFPLLPLFLLNSLQAADSRKWSVIVTGALVTGILVSIATFAVIAYFATSVGSFLLTNFTNLQAVLGIFILFFGVVMLSETLRRKLHLSRFSLKEQPAAPSNLKQVFLVGLGYTLMAAPCAGPSILAVISVFGAQSNPLVIVFMLILISMTIAVPYFAIALVTGEARTRMARSLSRYTRVIEIIVGVILIIIGFILILPALGIRFYV
ncbi:MAG: cytochrome c biogenesis CcdA family protein [Candidatus Odinarchaeota archaeon]